MAEFPSGQDIAILGPKSLVRDRTNKIQQGGNFSEDIEGDQIDELDLELSDAELLDLASKWESAYKAYEGKISKRQEANKRYYLGKQDQQQNVLNDKPVPSNILFEATETFLAQALAKNPDPVVYADNTPQGNEESKNVKTMLQYLADTLVFRRKLAMLVRHWNIYFIGVLKHGWDEEIHEITCDVRNPKNIILDPNGYVDAYGDFVGYIGERMTTTASKLAELFPEWKELIADTVSYKMGTDVTHTEWWTDEYTFTTFNKRVLDKSRNPHFNYPKKMKENKGDRVIQVLKEGNNHFSKPKKPYTFLSVFSLQEQPHDETSLIEQNIANQDLITRRTKQIARNYDMANNSAVFSLDHFDQQTAKQALTALEDGTGALCRGSVQDAVARFPAPSYPAEAFQELKMNMENLRSIYGTNGVTAQQPNEETTARGQILNQQHDSSRIGGGIGDALEQVADNTFNTQVQFMYVYYDEQHKAAILGALKGVEEAQIDDSSFNRKLVVSCAPDSMTPKDEITAANQAMSLFEAGALDPKTLLTIMNVPNSEETAESTVLWLLDKSAYMQEAFPEMMQQLQQMQAQQQAQAPQPAQPQPGNVVSPIQPPSLAEPPASGALANVPLPT